MPALWKRILLITILGIPFLPKDCFATHIVGGEIQYECLGFNAATQVGTYRIILHVYRDCFNGQAPFDNPASITVYQMGPIVSEWVTVNPTPVITNIPPETNNPCLTPPANICVEEGLYVATVNLPYNAAGYTISYQRCCRNNTIDNIVSPGASGSTYTIFLSAQAQQTCNSSPSYNAFPPIVICNGQPLIFDHSATDAQGDQLVYSLCAPELGASQNNPQPNVADPPPYNPVNFLNPYNANNPLGGNPPLSIDPVTGLLTATPLTLGQFVVGICVSEFRNGVLLSVTRRDFQFNVTSCIIAVEPTPEPDTSVTINLGGGLQVIEGRSCDNTVFFEYSLPAGTNPALIQNQVWTFWNPALGFQVTGTGPTITVQFPAPGLYDARIAVNPGLVGCSDSTDFQVRIYPPRVSAFTFAIDSCNASAPIVFTNNSQAFGQGNTITQYAWNFGLGLATSNQVSPTWLPPNAGSYNIRLRITDSNGCTATSSASTDWYPAANVQFAAADSAGCVAHTTTFTNTSFPYIASYVTEWDFGNGITFTGQTPGPIYYPDPGQFTVIAVVTSPWGCRSELIRPQYIDVFGQPAADFSTNFDTCDLGPVAFIDQTTPFPNQPLSAWNWTFGDGATGSVQNPVHQYDSTQAGNYPIQLIVTDGNGCRDTAQQTLNWFPEPVIAVNFSGAEGCVPYTVTFSNNSYPINGYTTVWDFGDGSTSLQASPTYTYTQPGIYPVLLVITSPNGICVDSFQTVITVNENPNAAFSYTFDTCAIAPVFFTSQATPNAVGDPLVSWQWSFGDGNDTLALNPAYQYTNSGNFSVSLVVTDANGCTDSIAQVVPWFPEPVVAVDILGQEGCFGDTVFFQNNSYPINGYITDWNFGDGTTSTQASPTHVYAVPGIYSVELTITSPTGWCQATFLDTIIVHENPQAAFSYSFDSCALGPVSFTSQASTNAAGDALTNWLWYFGDGDTAPTENAVHQYATIGSYTASFVVTDVNGCSDSIAQVVPWLPEPVIPVDILRQVGCVGDTFFFQNNAYPILGYSTEWNFGDGGTSSLASPTHVYTTQGVYTVTLTITSPSGWCAAVFFDTVTVHENPSASFVFFVDSCNLVPVVFTDQSAPNGAGDPLTTWYWNFDDGTDTTVFSPATFPHLPTNSGSFDVVLTVFDANGCRDTATRLVDWYPEPVVAVDILGQLGCLGETVVFQNNSYPINGYVTAWTFGDGTTSLLASPSHTYAVPGIYPVTLTITSPNGFCQKSFADTVVVNGLPVAAFSYGVTSCVLGPIPFSDLSVPNTNPIDNPIVSWYWTFGDAVDTFFQSPVYQYLNPGTYTVELVITDAAGCQDSTTQTLDWYPSTPFEIIVDDPEGCEPHTASFTFDTYGVDVTAYAKDWDFGDGTTFNGPAPPPHLYATPGTYIVSLSLTAPLTNCTQTDLDTVYVWNLPEPNFTYAYDSCSLGPVSFIDQSTSIDGTVDAWSWHFGGGDSSFIQNPDYAFDTIGDYNVTLIVTDDNGCVDSVALPVLYQPRPIYPVVLQDTQACTPFSLLFYDNIYPIVDYTTVWSFGDGNGSTDATPPPHLYPVAGAYPVTLTVSSTLGCVDTFAMTATALPLPVADFSFAPTNVSNLFPTVTFTDESIDADQWDWDFGMGTGSSQQNPVYTYPDTGLVTIELIVTHLNGCTDTTTQRLDVEPRYTYYLPNAFTPNGDGVNDGFRGEGITDYLRTFNFTIWNRWGELIFQTDNPNESWNGRKHNTGELCPAGVYVVFVELTGGRGEREELKGFATLIY